MTIAGAAPKPKTAEQPQLKLVGGRGEEPELQHESIPKPFISNLPDSDRERPQPDRDFEGSEQVGYGERTILFTAVSELKPNSSVELIPFCPGSFECQDTRSSNQWQKVDALQGLSIVIERGAETEESVQATFRFPSSETLQAPRDVAARLGVEQLEREITVELPSLKTAKDIALSLTQWENSLRYHGGSPGNQIVGSFRDLVVGHMYRYALDFPRIQNGS